MSATDLLKYARDSNRKGEDAGFTLQHPPGPDLFGPVLLVSHQQPRDHESTVQGSRFAESPGEGNNTHSDSSPVPPSQEATTRDTGRFLGVEMAPSLRHDPRAEPLAFSPQPASW